MTISGIEERYQNCVESVDTYTNMIQLEPIFRMVLFIEWSTVGQLVSKEVVVDVA